MVMTEELIAKASVIPYPSEMPIDEVRTVISIVAAKEFNTRKEELAKSLWIIVGYGLGKALKDPAVPGTTMAVQSLTDETALEVLDSIVRASEPGAPMAFQIPTSLIVWALDLLAKYLKD